MQHGLVLKTVVVVVFLQFGQFRLSLAVQLDLGKLETVVDGRRKTERKLEGEVPSFRND